MEGRKWFLAGFLLGDKGQDLPIREKNILSFNYSAGEGSPGISCVGLMTRCRDAESNCGHTDFQSVALPTELSRHPSKEDPSSFEKTWAFDLTAFVTFWSTFVNVSFIGVLNTLASIRMIAYLERDKDVHE